MADSPFRIGYGKDTKTGLYLLQIIIENLKDEKQAKDLAVAIGEWLAETGWMQIVQ